MKKHVFENGKTKAELVVGDKIVLIDSDCSWNGVHPNLTYHGFDMLVSNVFEKLAKYSWSFGKSCIVEDMYSSNIVGVITKATEKAFQFKVYVCFGKQAEKEYFFWLPKAALRTNAY